MEIKDFLAAKAEMELAIKTVVREAVKTFEDSTGYTPHGIWIETTECQTIGGKRNCHVLSVNSDVPIEHH